MNNNPKFDPMTGQPLQSSEEMPVNNTINQTTIEQSQINNESPIQPVINQPEINQNIQIQNELQNVPTVEQNKQEFINNVQSMNQEKKEEKKEGVNYVFIIILFIILLLSIYFLFPLLLKYI